MGVATAEEDEVADEASPLSLPCPSLPCAHASPGRSQRSGWKTSFDANAGKRACVVGRDREKTHTERRRRRSSSRKEEGIVEAEDAEDEKEMRISNHEKSHDFLSLSVCSSSLGFLLIAHSFVWCASFFSFFSFFSLFPLRSAHGRTP